MSVSTRTAAALTEEVRTLFLPAGGGEARSGPGRVGVEVELLPVSARTSPPRPAPLAAVRRALESDPTLSADARITFEPGGQLELSPAPQPTATDCLSRLDDLLERVHRCVTPAGIALLPAALSPWSDAAEVGLQNPLARYRSMQAHFDRRGPAGRRMMRLSGALQVCLDLGGPTRWHLLNRIGPTLAATFAASPLLAGRPTGQRSTRIAVWLQVDPTRTGFDGAQLTGEPVPAYEAFALAASAIPLPRNGEPEQGGPGTGSSDEMSLLQWLEEGNGRPDEEDVRHHLSTLFPPVRPRCYHEVRYLDGLPLRWARVAVCLLAALTASAATERQALAVIDRSTEPNLAAWHRAACLGMEEPGFRRAATALFDIALGALPLLPRGYMPPEAGRWLAEYRDRFPAAGRCPADDLLESHAQGPGSIEPWL